MSDLKDRLLHKHQELRDTCDDGFDLDVAALLRDGAVRIAELEAALALRDRRITILANACLEARSVFQEYVRHHRAKYPPETEKADRNVRLADMLGNALTTFPAKTNHKETAGDR